MVSVSCFGIRVSVRFHFMFVHYESQSEITEPYLITLKSSKIDMY